jgi:hypothetical protein
LGQKVPEVVPAAPALPPPADFSKKNPFGDFSSFEESIEQMQPIVPEVTSEDLERKLKERKIEIVKMQEE